MRTPQKHYYVIVNYNSGQNILSCIQSILHSEKIRPHIIVVDNASRDASLEKCKTHFPKATYIYNSHNIGFAAAANIGARYALERGAASVTFCNPDAYVDKSCLFRTTQIIENGHADIVSPVIYTHKSQQKWFSGGVINFLRMRAIHKDFLHKTPFVRNNAFISGCIMTVSPRVFQKIGLFDESFFLYYEDADFSLRAQSEGFSLAIVDNAYAFHKEVSENDQKTKTYFLVLSGLIFFKKHTKGLHRTYFHFHYLMRKIKNYFDRKKNKPLAHAVYQAFVDFDSKAHV